MLYKAKNAPEALKIGLEEHGGSRLALARALGINNAHIYRALPAKGGEGEVTETLKARLIELGWIPAKPTRVRLAADLYDQWADRDGSMAYLRRQVLRDHAAAQGHESWSDYVRALADELIIQGEKHGRETKVGTGPLRKRNG